MPCSHCTNTTVKMCCPYLNLELVLNIRIPNSFISNRLMLNSVMLNRRFWRLRRCCDVSSGVELISNSVVFTHPNIKNNKIIEIGKILFYFSSIDNSSCMFRCEGTPEWREIPPGVNILSPGSTVFYLTQQTWKYFFTHLHQMFLHEKKLNNLISQWKDLWWSGGKWKVGYQKEYLFILTCKYNFCPTLPIKYLIFLNVVLYSTSLPSPHLTGGIHVFGQNKYM